MSIRSFAPATLLLATALVGCSPDAVTSLDTERPSLITYGKPTGDAHPEVVLIIMDVDDAPSYRCSGTLITPTRVLTAGHCTGEEGEFSGMRIFTESDVRNGDNNYPFAGNNTIEASDWHTHPDYTSAGFYLNDVGVIELSEAVDLPEDQYGTLPAVNSLDDLKRGSSAKFTAVGYGLQRINPVFVESRLERTLATPHLIQINTGFTGSRSLLLSNNASTGGTCFGDSGGPNYVGTSNVVGGVTSFGINGNCAGTGGVFRMDQQDVLDFVNEHLP
ncbi:MAG: trypsin-like serine protease [Gemmatimonadota bacterium]